MGDSDERVREREKNGDFLLPFFPVPREGVVAVQEQQKIFTCDQTTLPVVASFPYIKGKEKVFLC